MAGTIPIAELDAQAEASGQPDVWAECAITVGHKIARCRHDLARDRRELDLCPSTPCGLALARLLLSECQRREAEIQRCERHLARLRRDCGPAFVDAAAAEAPAARGLWIVLPGGSERDG